MDVRSHFLELANRRSPNIAIYFGERTVDWAELGSAALAVADAVAQAQIPLGARMGWVARNTPGSVASALGLLVSGCCIAPINANDPPAKIASEYARRGFAGIVAHQADWNEQLSEAVRARGDLGLEVLTDDALGVRIRHPRDAAASTPAPQTEYTVMERMSSGTTGEPKRIPVTNVVFAKAMRSALKKNHVDLNKELRSPAMLAMPFAHSGGIWALMVALYEGRPIVLHERFKVEAFLQSVRQFRPKVMQLVPSMVQMILESPATTDDLNGMICIRCGTAPLDAEVKRLFEERFGIPILQDYGATEFMGGVAGWTLDDHRNFGKSKSASVGHVRPDIEILIRDPENDANLPLEETGILWMKSDRFGPDWIKTTDIASIDADRFLYIHGRSDEAIIRGGFKILPEKVAEVLRKHPDVRDACVLGVKDERLGQIPLAIIETRNGAADTRQLEARELEAFVRDHLPAYQIPAHFEFMTALPRTVSLKVARPALREQFKAKYDF